MEEAFFERQSDDSQNCSVHSLNNALGFHALDSNVVNKSIDKRIELFARFMGMVPTDPKLALYKGKLSTNKTFFSAESVWIAAQELGIMKSPIAISGFGGNYTHVKSEMLGMNLIILGIRKDGAYHAVAARNGMIYDSLNKGGPVLLSDENLSIIYKKVFAAYRINNK